MDALHNRVDYFRMPHNKSGKDYVNEIKKRLIKVRQVYETTKPQDVEETKCLLSVCYEVGAKAAS